eukprot:753149-Alexandrium_andersonii.AAC.1
MQCRTGSAARRAIPTWPTSRLARRPADRRVLACAAGGGGGLGGSSQEDSHSACKLSWRGTSGS